MKPMPVPLSRLALLVAAGSLAACVPAVGPYEVQANQAAVACQQGYQQACYDYQAVAPAAQAESAYNAQNAAVGSALAAGVVGAAAGAAIVGASRGPRYYGRGYYGRPYYGRPYYGGRYYR